MTVNRRLALEIIADLHKALTAACDLRLKAMLERSLLVWRGLEASAYD